MGPLNLTQLCIERNGCDQYSHDNIFSKKIQGRAGWGFVGDGAGETFIRAAAFIGCNTVN